ncbi:hypothetical protein DIE06_05980 [Burkholderia sp. Bp8998]|nr:hypothetical protein DIE06_05980 [Burkholderia sp. Bp8998]
MECATESTCTSRNNIRNTIGLTDTHADVGTRTTDANYSMWTTMCIAWFAIISPNRKSFIGRRCLRGKASIPATAK